MSLPIVASVIPPPKGSIVYSTHAVVCIYSVPLVLPSEVKHIVPPLAMRFQCVFCFGVPDFEYCDQWSFISASLTCVLSTDITTLGGGVTAIPRVSLS